MYQKYCKTNQKQVWEYHKIWLWKSKKFWEELIDHFPSIQHIMHWKRRSQQFFIATGTSLPSCYLATIWGYKHRPIGSSLIDIDRTENDASKILASLLAFIAAGTCLPNRCLTTRGGMHIKTHRLIGGICEVCRWNGLRYRVIHTRFNKDWFRHSKLNRVGYTDTQIGWSSQKPTFGKYHENWCVHAI
jgi:hypothetical protein